MPDDKFSHIKNKPLEEIEKIEDENHQSKVNRIYKGKDKRHQHGTPNVRHFSRDNRRRKGL